MRSTPPPSSVPLRWVLLALAALLACGGEPAAPDTVRHSKVGLSGAFHVDRKYRSMEGPVQNASFTLGEGPSRILWITGYRTEVVGADGVTSESGDFMCHTNMVLDAKAHARLFGQDRPTLYNRLFTTSQGQFSVELPDGFGIPVLSDEVLGVNTQVLNLNLDDPGVDVRFKLTIEYVSDADAGATMKPLFPSMAYVMARVDGGTGVYGVEHPNEMQSQASCLPGDIAPQSMSVDKKGLIVDAFGNKFTGHWVVPPGREVRRTLVTELLAIPYDTTIHYIGVHLHPFAESLELRDLTTGKTLYRSEARAPASAIGLAHVERYSSAEGIPVYRDHEYEMVSVYDNTSGVDQDAMATFFVYMYDPEAEQALELARRDG